MYCKNCGAGGIDEKAVVCTGCGVSLKSKPTFDLSKLSEIKAETLKKNPAMIAAGVALLACMFPWVKMSAFGLLNTGFSMFSLSHALMMSDTILSQGLLYLFPLSLMGLIAADFLPQISKYKRVFGYASLGLMVYATIGLYQLSHPSQNSGNALLRMATKDIYSVGWGYYVAAIGTIAAAILSKFYKKDKEETVKTEQQVVV